VVERAEGPSVELLLQILVRVGTEHENFKNSSKEDLDVQASSESKLRACIRRVSFFLATCHLDP
jgi:hypothetical protein